MARKTLLADKEFDRQCPWNDHGYQCQENGWLADSLNGKGPWYCRKHYAQLHGRESFTAPIDDMSQAAVDERVNKIVPRWPGETEHAWSMRCKDWCLAKLKGGVLRQPGEDEQEAA